MSKSRAEYYRRYREQKKLDMLYKLYFFTLDTSETIPQQIQKIREEYTEAINSYILHGDTIDTKIEIMDLIQACITYLYKTNYKKANEEFEKKIEKYAMEGKFRIKRKLKLEGSR